MPNMWVKNVYNLGTDQGITRGLLSTLTSPSYNIPNSAVYIPSVLPSLIPAFYPHKSTPIISLFNLLYGLLSTLSTGPIITKTKEKKERNT